MSPALDVSLFAFSSIVDMSPASQVLAGGGQVFKCLCYFSESRCFQPIFSHTHWSVCVHFHDPVSGDIAQSSDVCHLLSAENREQKIFSLENLQTFSQSFFLFIFLSWLALKVVDKVEESHILYVWRQILVFTTEQQS